MAAEYVDILHLIHDIHIAKKSKSKFRHYLDDIQLINTRLIFNCYIELIKFIKQTVNARKKQYLTAALIDDEKQIFSSNRHNDKDHVPINWLSIFYNKDFNDISQRLSSISPILSLYKKQIINDKGFDAINIIRECIPYSSKIKGIDNNNYSSLNVEQLFGEFKYLNIDHLSLDLLKQIVSYFDIIQFFKCSQINHCWLNLIYRNDSFYGIFKQIQQSMQCVIVDHSSLNRMESIYLKKIYINWQLRSNSIYLDFITLQRSWIEQYIDPNSVKLTLQQKYKKDKNNANTNDDKQWIDIKSVETNTKKSEKLFDSINVFNLIDDIKSKDDEEIQSENIAFYRLKIDISRPFKWIFYTEPDELHPFEWHHRYHGNNNNSIGIDAEQQFWFDYYSELLHSMIDTDISQSLATILEAAQRMRFDHEFVQNQLLNKDLMKQIIRLIKHKDWRIQHNAAILLANLFATNDYNVREKYLKLCTQHIKDYNVIDITIKEIYNLLNKRQFNLHEAEYRVCRSLICIVGNYVISKNKNDKDDKWKKLALIHPINYISFMINILNQEAAQIDKQHTMNEPINVWSFRAMAIWSLCTFYRHKSEDETVNKILNTKCSRNIMHLLLDWTVIVGDEYLLNDKQMNNKMNKFLNKLNKTQEQFDKEQRCFSTVLAECCIGIQRIFSGQYHKLNEILNMDIAKKLSVQILDIAIKGISVDWAQYLTHLALKLIAQTLRFHGGFAKQYIDLKLSNKLYSILQIIKKTLPNEKSFVSSVKNWIKTKKRNSISSPTSSASSSNNDRREIQKINSFIELYDDIIEITNSVTKHKQFFNVTELILDILCIYCQRDKCDEQYLQHCLAYLWNSLTQHPIHFKKVIIKHKGFIKLLNQWTINNKQHGIVFNGIVSNVCSVLNDNNLFNKTFAKNIIYNDIDNDNDEKKQAMNDCYCPCGEKLEIKEAKNCYEKSQWLYCDLCMIKISGHTKVYHCDRKQPDHKNGYDLCLSCAKRRELIKSSKTNK